ncbi:helix-turn-helix transcriptional regulator [Peribacillus acanthi]|uniref:helix-turn-helix transcriptional regulator n=1 Tax=Peribacillus acanthi TaxID=2171554 RepID=UPI000D3EC162|nr:helix-turn-helix transcriptional regulator [Peribacillus acanthi]
MLSSLLLEIELFTVFTLRLADKVGVTRQTIVSLEKGTYSPSLELAFRIARAFDLFLEKVFF